jgi:hypothetical protein
MQGSRYFLTDESGKEEEINQDQYYRLWKSKAKRPAEFKDVKIRREIAKVILIPNCLQTKR